MIFIDYSYFVNAVVGSIEKLITHSNMVQHYLDGYRPDSHGWQLMQTAMGEANTLAEKHGFKLAVALFPVLVQLDENYPFESIHKTIETFMRSENTLFLDFLGVFRGHEDKTLWVHEKDLHPNEFATSAAARKLAEFLIENQLVP